MKNITRRSTALAAAFLLALSSMALAAPKSDRAKRHLTLYGKVLKVNQKARMILVSERSTEKLFLVNVPEGARFQITFGQNMKMDWPEIRDVFKNNRVRINCTRTDREHLSRLEDGGQAVVLTAAR
jgi:hypothetical protein